MARMRETPIDPDPPSDPPHPMGHLFGHMREYRRGLYENYDLERGARKSRCVMTLVRDEAIFLPIWLNYYSRFFDPEDIHVLDHQTRDGSTAGEGFVRIPVEHESVDMIWMGEVIADYQRMLFETYDVVLLADVDEIIAPNPQLGTLRDYIDRFDEEFVNCLGYEILHMRETEGPYDPTRPVLDQRSTWFANDGYDKPLLSSGPMKWVPGFHSRVDARFNPDPDLRLIHLHRMDFEICRRRHEERRKMIWNQNDIDNDWAAHNRITEREEFERWFYSDTGLPGLDLVTEPIYASWKSLGF